MKSITLLLLFISSYSLYSQELTNVTKTQSTTDFTRVSDSIAKLTDPQNSVIIKIADGSRECYITKVGTRYKGYFIKNLIAGIEPPTLEDEKPIITEIITFDTDIIYQNLIKENLNNIVQLTEKQIQQQRTGKSNMFYSIPSASHDGKMTIIIKGPSPKLASYGWALVQSKDWHGVAVIKTFYNIQEYLINTFKEYY